jgi:hypothetical protein
MLAFLLLTHLVAWFISFASGGAEAATRFLNSIRIYQAWRLLLSPWVLYPFSFVIVLWVIAFAARIGRYGPEAAILTVIGIGWFYKRFFAPETYYRIDTLIMFRTAVHEAMIEAIDAVTVGKGLRGLSEEERRPIFDKFI